MNGASWVVARLVAAVDAGCAAGALLALCWTTAELTRGGADGSVWLAFVWLLAPACFGILLLAVRGILGEPSGVDDAVLAVVVVGGGLLALAIQPVTAALVIPVAAGVVLVQSAVRAALGTGRRSTTMALAGTALVLALVALPAPPGTGMVALLCGMLVGAVSVCADAHLRDRLESASAVGAAPRD